MVATSGKGRYLVKTRNPPNLPGTRNDDFGENPFMSIFDSLTSRFIQIVADSLILS